MTTTNKLTKEERQKLKREEAHDRSVFLEMRRRLKYKGALVEDEEENLHEDLAEEEDDEPTEQQLQYPLTEEDILELKIKV